MGPFLRCEDMFKLLFCSRVCASGTTITLASCVGAAQESAEVAPGVGLGDMRSVVKQEREEFSGEMLLLRLDDTLNEEQVALIINSWVELAASQKPDEFPVELLAL